MGSTPIFDALREPEPDPAPAAPGWAGGTPPRPPTTAVWPVPGRARVAEAAKPTPEPAAPAPAPAPVAPPVSSAAGPAAAGAAPRRPSIVPGRRAGTSRPSRGPAPHPVARLSVNVVWVATLAEQEALDLGHAHLGTEHLLLAIVRLGDAVGRRLATHGATLEALRRAVVRSGTRETVAAATGRPGWSTVASAAVNAARVRARDAGRPEVSTGDLTASLLAPGSRAVALLQGLGVDPDVVAEPPGPVTIPALAVPAEVGVPAVPVGPDVRPAASGLRHDPLLAEAVARVLGGASRAVGPAAGRADVAAAPGADRRSALAEVPTVPPPPAPAVPGAPDTAHRVPEQNVPEQDVIGPRAPAPRRAPRREADRPAGVA